MSWARRELTLKATSSASPTKGTAPTTVSTTTNATMTASMRTGRPKREARNTRYRPMRAPIASPTYGMKPMMASRPMLKGSLGERSGSESAYQAKVRRWLYRRCASWSFWAGAESRMWVKVDGVLGEYDW